MRTVSQPRRRHLITSPSSSAGALARAGGGPPGPPAVGRMGPRNAERVDACKRLREVAARLGVARAADNAGRQTRVRRLTGGPTLGEGPDYNTGASQQAVSAEPPPPGYLAVCMLKPACIPFKYYNNQSRQGFNMAT